MSLGAYPTDAYYDPNRPSWLPYWIDDSTESAAKYGTDSVVGQMGGVVGAAAGTVVNVLGEAVGGAAGAAVQSATLNWLPIAILAGVVLWVMKR